MNFVVKTGMPILGMDLVSALNLQICGAKLVSETPATCVLHKLNNNFSDQDQRNNTEIFDFAKGFVHKICANVKPSQQKLR